MRSGAKTGRERSRRWADSVAGPAAYAPRVFTLEVNAVFSAAHAIVVAGVREPLHGHDWHVTATVEGPELDGDGLLTDFHALKQDVDAVIAPFQNANLNEVSVLAGVNPTAEAVAKHVAEALAARLSARMARYLPTGTPGGRGVTGAAGAAGVARGPVPVRVRSLRVTESPGCAATYWPPA